MYFFLRSSTVIFNTCRTFQVCNTPLKHLIETFALHFTACVGRSPVTSVSAWTEKNKKIKFDERQHLNEYLYMCVLHCGCKRFSLVFSTLLWLWSSTGPWRFTAVLLVLHGPRSDHNDGYEKQHDHHQHPWRRRSERKKRNQIASQSHCVNVNFQQNPQKDLLYNKWILLTTPVGKITTATRASAWCFINHNKKRLFAVMF